jgi:hypothetical protein
VLDVIYAQGLFFCFRGRRGDLLKVIWYDCQSARAYSQSVWSGTASYGQARPAGGAASIWLYLTSMARFTISGRSGYG